jgi:hypothetical protein
VKVDTVVPRTVDRSHAVDLQSPLSWPAVVAGGVLTGMLGGAAVALVAAIALIVWLLVRAVPRGALVVPGAIASWCGLMAILLG